MSGRLRIGDVAALTGITPGRIRHYDGLGLIAPGHLDSGYRTFGPEEIARLVHIDLLRTFGLGLDQIAIALRDAPGLRRVLERHRVALVAERERVSALLDRCERALAAETDERLITELALAQRARLGSLGRLERPLRSKAAAHLGELLEEALRLPVPAAFTQMVLPAPVTDLLERLLALPGHERLFEALTSLAGGVMAVVAAGDRAAAVQLGRDWVRESLADPPPPAVLDELRRSAPGLRRLAVIRSGIPLWVEAIHPLAGEVLRSIEEAGRRQGAIVLTAIVIPRDSAVRSPTASVAGCVPD